LSECFISTATTGNESFFAGDIAAVQPFPNMRLKCHGIFDSEASSEFKKRSVLFARLLIQGRLERMETNLMHFKREVA